MGPLPLGSSVSAAAVFDERKERRRRIGVIDIVACLVFVWEEVLILVLMSDDECNRRVCPRPRFVVQAGNGLKMFTKKTGEKRGEILRVKSSDK